MPQLTLRPLFFEVPNLESDPIFIGRQWLIRDLDEIISSSSSGIIIAGEPGTGKSAIMLQLVEHSCFGTKKDSIYDQVRDVDEIYSEMTQSDVFKSDMINFSSHVVGYHFCQVNKLMIYFFKIKL